jgi:hypothetical protein
VITEDSVTGVGSTWNQANAYSGGGAGPMGGFESLPNPVSYNVMVYDHVAREIQPDFTGIPNAYGTSAAAGAVFTNNFTFNIDPTWDDQWIHIISMFINPSGKVNNAASIKIAEVTAGVTENANEANVNLYPNPSTDNANILLDLAKASPVSVEVYSVNGALIAKKDYGTLNGQMMLPVNSSTFKAGMYFINVTIDGKTTVRKLVKQ